MPTLEQINEQIKKLSNLDTFGTRKEIKSLPGILTENEQILGMTSGFCNGHTWLITLTQFRIIFLDKGMIYGMSQSETPLSKINTIQYKTGMFMGEITIMDGGKGYRVDKVSKSACKPFVDAVNIAISNIGRPSKVTPPNESKIDVTEALMKLAALKEKGILTDEEFNQQKGKLLAG